MNNTEECVQRAIKALETTMIGSLSKFENVFGYLWAHYKDNADQLTEQEAYFDNMWQDVRNNILNHGNKQKRLLEEDLTKILSGNKNTRYNYRFPVINKDKENRE